VSADWLLGESPSLERVSKADRIAASSATVVPEPCSIDKTSLCSVARALESELLDELLELPELPLDVPVEVDAVAVVEVVDVELVVDVCPWCAWTRAAT
jgi:hypothetical protein